ncbi:hypothetical protein U6S03_12245, partial [Cutibacterium acnes]
EGCFYRIFDARLAINNSDSIFGVTVSPVFPPVHKDLAVEHPPVVVFFVWPARLAHVFAHSAGGFDFCAFGFGEGDLGVENVFEG